MGVIQIIPRLRYIIMFRIMKKATPFYNMKRKQMIIIKQELGKRILGETRFDKGMLRFQPTNQDRINNVGIMFREAVAKFGSPFNLKYDR